MEFVVVCGCFKMVACRAVSKNSPIARIDQAVRVFLAEQASGEGMDFVIQFLYSESRFERDS